MQTSIKHIRRFALIVLTFGLIFYVSPVNAQQEEQQQQEPQQEQEAITTDSTQQLQEEIRVNFSDEELQSFLNANAKVVEIQNESEQKMIKAIEAEGITVERFNELLQSQQTQDSTVQATPDEMQALNKAATLLLEERPKIEQKMISTIEEEGIDLETYQQIMIAYQQNPELQSRINNLLSGDN